MNQLMQIAKQALTEDDNQTADIFRILVCLGVLAFIVFSGYSLWHLPESWNPINYGSGFAALIAGAGAALRLRDGPVNPQLPAGPTTTVEVAGNAQEKA